MSILEQAVRAEVESWLRWRRWLFLSIGVFLFALGCDSARAHGDGASISVLLGLIGGAYFIAYALGRWKGDTHARLILALIDEQRKKA
ncbi:MAG: hypothetical protein ABI273_11750 [Lacunisphaera sp.]